MLSLVVLALSACAGTRYASLKVNDDGSVTHAGSSIGFLTPPNAGPTELAEAARIRAQAKMIEALSREGASSNGKTSAKGYILALVNNDPHKEIYTYHPEFTGLKIKAKPKGGSDFIRVKNIPFEVVIYSGDKIVKTFRPRDDPDFQEKMSHTKPVDGIDVNLVFQIDKVY